MQRMGRFRDAWMLHIATRGVSKWVGRRALLSLMSLLCAAGSGYCDEDRYNVTSSPSFGREVEDWIYGEGGEGMGCVVTLPLCAFC